MLGHNALSGTIPDELGQLVNLEFLTLNYNQLNGQFPSFMAPRQLGYCYMTPNQFQLCPDESIANNPDSMAFQCAVHCAKVGQHTSDANHNRLRSSAILSLLPSMIALLFITARYNAS